MGNGLDGPGFEPWQREEIFFCSEKDPVQVWVPSYILCSGYRDSLPSVKWPERDVDHSPPSSVEVMKKWNCTSNPPICLHDVDTDNFNF